MTTITRPRPVEEVPDLALERFRRLERWHIVPTAHDDPTDLVPRVDVLDLDAPIGSHVLAAGVTLTQAHDLVDVHRCFPLPDGGVS